MSCNSNFFRDVCSDIQLKIFFQEERGDEMEVQNDE